VLGIPLFLAARILFYLYFRFLKKRYTKPRQAAVQQVLSEKQMNRWLLLPAGLLGLYTALNIVSNYWWQILQFMNQTAVWPDRPGF
jgi:uncharacterized protein